MFRKKRRLELALRSEKKRQPQGPDDGKTLNRRLFLLRGAVGLGFTALAGKLWRMQIARGSSFQNVAEGNVLQFERLSAPRGRIVDRNGITLAENRRAWTVKLTPARLPSDGDRRQQVLRTVADLLDLGDALVLDRALIPMGSEAAVINKLEERMEVDGDALLTKLKEQGASMVLVKDELNPEEAADLDQRMSDIPGLRVVNVLDYQLAAHGTSEQSLIVKRDVERETAMAIGANAVYLPGITVDDNELIRHYSAGPSFSHLLGYVGPITEEEYNAATTVTGTPVYDLNDVVGRGGVEQAMEQELRGTKGGRWVQVDAQGIERFELLDRRREPIPGLSVQLTIDSEFQKVATEALQEGIDNANRAAQAEDLQEVGAGVAIAINPKNGEIIAMVSLPTFDNSDFINGISQEKYEAYQNDPSNPLLHRAISGTYPPGSVFKPLVACAALQEGVISAETEFECHGRIRVPWTWDESQGNTYLCWIGQPGHGPTNIYSGIAHSCDIYFYNLGAPGDRPEDVPNADDLHYYNPNDPERHYFRGLGIDRIARYISDEFGYGQVTGIELAGEATGVVPTPKWLYQELGEYWSVGDTINVSIGQGHLLNTPLQLANATAAVANGGTLWRPRLVRSLVRDDGRVVREYPPKESRKLAIDDEHFEAVREGMRQTITRGTGAGQITFDDPPVGGKSGTAEYGQAVDGKYANSHAWFTAFGPYEDPEIAVVVLVAGGMVGSTYAGPVANKILDAYFHQRA